MRDTTASEREDRSGQRGAPAARDTDGEDDRERLDHLDRGREEGGGDQ